MAADHGDGGAAEDGHREVLAEELGHGGETSEAPDGPPKPSEPLEPPNRGWNLANSRGFTAHSGG